MIDWSKYEFRCSSLGDIMTNDRSGKKMGQTCINKLIQIWWKEMYDVEKPLSTKHMEKGIICERDGIDLLSRLVYDGEYLVNNKTRKQNGFISGECDVYRKDIGKIHDTKISWDVETFSKAYMSKTYEWQGIGYMWLWDCDEFELNPCLISTPEHLVMDELRRLAYYMDDAEGTSDKYLEMELQIQRSMNFERIPEELRLKRIPLKRDKSKEDDSIIRITECRKWLSNFDPKKLI